MPRWASADSSSSAPPLAGGRWQVQLLGGLRALNGDVLLSHFGSRPVALLFARLALQPRTEHSRERLAEWLWPELRPRQGRRVSDATEIRRTRLRRALSTLCGLLEQPGLAPGTAIIARRDTLQLNAAAFETDVGQFEDFVQRGDAAAAHTCYRGELLPGFDDAWVEEQRARLAGLLNRLESADVGLGVTPDPEADQARPPMVPYLTTFIDRRDELRVLQAALASHRLITVTGPGGCGKTRLCAQAAAAAAGFELACFVALAECTQPAQTMDHVRAALRLSAGTVAPLDQVAARLSGLRTLLVMDNFEQLVGDDGEAALAALLDRLPQLHLLVSTRRALRRPDAFVLPLAPLPVPTADDGLSAAALNPCVALFVDRARAARADFHVHARNVGGLVDACRALEGLPLAIELAASQVRRHSPRDICDALVRGLAVLARTGPRARKDGRHNSLEVTLDWSWRLLDAPQREALGCLSVFRGGWTFAQALAVIAGHEPTHQLETLVRDSLVQAQPDTGGHPRYNMLNSVRDFVRERTQPQQLKAASLRHLRHFRGVAVALGARHDVAAEADMANFTAALGTAVAEEDRAAALAIALGLGPHWLARGAAPQALDLLRQMADAGQADAAGQGSLLALLPRLLTNAGHAKEALARSSAALLAAGDQPGRRAEALLTDTLVRWLAERDCATALAPAREALRLCQAAGNPDSQARAMLLLGAVSLMAGHDVQAAARLFEEAERSFGALRDRRGSLLALPGRVACLMAEGRHREAVAVATAGEELAAELGDVATQLQLCTRLSVSHEAQRRFDLALAVCQRQTRVARAHGMAYNLAYGLWNQCRPLAHLRQPEPAVLLMAYSSRTWVALFGPLDDSDERHVLLVRRLATVQLGAARCAALWQQGLALGEREAVSLGSG